MAKAAKRKAAAEKHLPKHAPRKSGKRGISAPPEEAEHVISTAQEEQQEAGGQGDKLFPDNTPKKKPRQKRLPTMEDHRLPDLEEAALSYAEKRDARMALLRKETDQKDVLHNLMRRYDKKIYRVESMEISVVSKEETVKVKILEEED